MGDSLVGFMVDSLTAVKGVSLNRTDENLVHGADVIILRQENWGTVLKQTDLVRLVRS